MKKMISLIISLLMLTGTVLSVSADDASPFSDVKTSRWSYEAIRYAVEKGYMNGIGDGKFDPESSMYRRDLIIIFYRMAGSPAVTGAKPYTDIDFTGRAGLVVGAEGTGISRLVRDTCDFIAVLPMLGRIESLNAGVAAAVCLYEMIRQRTAHQQ